MSWGVGVILCALVFFLHHRRLRRQAGGLSPYSTDRDCWLAETSVGPLVLGVWRARIVLPKDFDARYTADERELILAHERAHLAAADPATNLVFAALQCALWFNPFAHIAARLRRLDQEMACDARVLSTRSGAAKAYAEIMLKAQFVASSISPLACYWPAGGAARLKERIAMLKYAPPSPRVRRLTILGFITLYAAGYTAAWAAQPPRIEHPGSVIAKPDWTEKPSGEDLIQYYPPEALKAEHSGAATIKCKVAATGTLEGCQVISETPVGEGFGPAAVAMSAKFRLRPVMKDGRAVTGGIVVIPIRFALAKPRLTAEGHPPS